MIDKRTRGRPRIYTPEEAYQRTMDRARKHTQENQVMRLWSCAKQRARKQGLPFTIRQEDIIIPAECAYLSVPLTNISGSGRVPTNASIDRIDSNKGYTKENIQVISDLANRMKQNATAEQLICFSRSVLNIQEKN
jgi:hypothetical protein